MVNRKKSSEEKALRRKRGQESPEDGTDSDEEVQVDKPSYLTDGSSDNWDRLLPMMLEHKLLSNIDADQLARYCVILDRYVRAEIEIAENGEVVFQELSRTRTRDGIPTPNPKDPVTKLYSKPIKNPWVAIAHDCSQELRRYEKAMRMTKDSNPDLHSVPKKKKPKKSGPESHFT